VPPTRYRPDIPQWLESILLKAVAKNPMKRFETAEEWTIALEKGEHAPFISLRAPMAERDPLRMWQLVVAISVMVNLLLFYLLWAR
jgi:protein phosphatase